MKEKFKKGLKMFAICFMAIVSCFTIFGCKNNSPEDPDKGNGETTTTLNADEKYTEFKNTVNATTPVNGYTMYSSETMSTEYGEVDYSNCDFSAMGLTSEEEINAFKAEMSEGLEDEQMSFSTDYAYDATTKNGSMFTYYDSRLQSFEISQGNTLYVKYFDNDEESRTLFRTHKVGQINTKSGKCVLK